MLAIPVADDCSSSSGPRPHAKEFSPYPERGIVNDLRRGSGKSRQGEIAVLCLERECASMKMNEYRDDSEPFSVPYSANDTDDRTDQGPDIDRAGHNRVFRIGNSPDGAIAGAIANRGPFPLRTLIVCFTIWLIATQAMIFDQVKFDERARLLEQQARALGVPQVAVPNERQSNLPTGAKGQRL
jgi:hypothetical protein